jgi:hypothetical protein
MATVTIAGCTLAVAPATLGFVKKKLLPWKARLPEGTSEAEVLAWAVDGILLYLGDQVDAAWVDDHIVSPTKLLEVLRVAAGQEGPSGEALGP